ncbi:hypothetical protein [Cohnella nanjingensis]|uniref:Uncharacterized protein n=1 Tax=Cohnella nanjingensis TaxID=1387779 RepID=A0A7X0VDI4_9BACL|nr:hypothetical protein [Cohnella nanjingensis]MBB6670012.1 hypothetical protein [Cohnella nanjingensis]
MSLSTPFRLFRHQIDCLIQVHWHEFFEITLVTAGTGTHIFDGLKSPKVGIAISDGYLVLRDKNTIYFGRLLDGNFPDINHIFVKNDQGAAISVSRAMMDDSLHRMLSLVDVENNRVTLELNEIGELTGAFSVCNW